MNFTLKRYGRYHFVDIKKKVLDLKTIKKICTIIKKNNIVINCENIEKLENCATVELLCLYNISLVNGSANLIAQAGLLGQRFFPKFYLSKEDCINNKRILVKRRFHLV